jgi:hypothetical protein
MTRSESLESVFVGPLRADWTVGQLLDWIGADDVRCHEVHLEGILDAVDRALHPDSSRAGGSVVALVRSLAMRVSADPGVGERTLGGIVGACQPEEPVSVGVVEALVPV